MVRWNEALHPRAADGKFGHGSGHGHTAGTGRAAREARVAARTSDVTVSHRNTGAMTDEQFHARAARVEKLMGRDSPLVKTHATDTTQTLPGGGWRPERDKIHREIVADIYAKHSNVPNEGRAYIAGGLGGAGKTTVLTKHANVDTSKYMTINPDDIKEELVRRGLVPDVPGAADLSPMERSTLVHEESSRIAMMLADKAYRDKKNVMWDITMSSEKSVASRVTAMKGAGYGQINGVFVDIPVEESVKRAISRYRRGADKYNNGEGPGGRYVPPGIIRAQQTSSGATINREVFAALKSSFGAWEVWDNGVTGRDPVLVEKG